VVDAHFYLADCYYRAGKLEESMPHFAYVLNMPKSSYTEPSLLGAARVAFELGENEKAARYYEQLGQAAGTKATAVEARVGKLRADFAANNYVAAIAAAEVVLATDNLAAELKEEAHFKRARSYRALGAAAKALEDFVLVAQNMKTKNGAESKFRVIEYLYSKNDLEQVEKNVFEFSKSGTPYQYWLAKSFIVLGDVYVKRNDAFQARATYESIIDGYTVTNDGIIAEVVQKIQQFVAAEKEKEAKAAQQAPVDVVVN
jgi:TolA-binding protein